jgi:hypothetical protein
MHSKARAHNEAHARRLQHTPALAIADLTPLACNLHHSSQQQTLARLISTSLPKVGTRNTGTVSHTP